MKKLSKLEKGNIIGIYSPSAPATFTAPKRFERAKNFLRGKEVRVFIYWKES